jgi:hypothetical protein
MHLEVGELVEGGSEGGEVKRAALQQHFLQLLSHLLAAVVELPLFCLAEDGLAVVVEGVEGEVAAVGSESEEAVGAEGEEGEGEGDIVGLVDCHVVDIPQLDLVVAAPLAVSLTLELRPRLLLVGLALVGDESVEVFVSGQVCDHLPGLVLDDDSMRGRVLLLVDGEQVILLAATWLQVEYLNELFPSLAFLTLLHLLDHCPASTAPARLQLGVAVAHHLLAQGLAGCAIVGDAFLLDVAVRGVEGEAREVGAEVAEEEVVKGGVEAHAPELDVVVDLVGDFEVVHLRPQPLSLEHPQTVHHQLDDHHRVTLQHQRHKGSAQRHCPHAPQWQSLAHQQQRVGPVRVGAVQVVLLP